ncbi:MAG: hypothetical protein D6702_00125 [Planctomycetota bacterium]|nr:MAG: hypothetical protein D6702_00125 [Planctomycetota bacterium]
MPQAPILAAALPFDVRPGEVERNLEAALAGLEQAAAAGAALLLLPEKWPTSFLPRFDAATCAAAAAALETVHARARRLGVRVVGSGPGGGPPRPFNELHVLGGARIERPYRKRVLFSPTGEGRQCRPGGELPPVFELGSVRAAGVICYDLRFPELTRPPFRRGAELLLVPAQWPTPRAPVFELLVRARAAENQCWVLACNRSGRAPLGDRRLLEFPGTALLADPLGGVAVRRDDGGLLLGEIDPAAAAEARRLVPCARDARRAGLWPEDSV